MLKKVITSTGTRAMTIQAPPANLVMAMSSMTTAEAMPPTPLTTDLACQWRPRFLDQCTTMPVWLMVKPRNTPRAYRGSRMSVLAWNRNTSVPDSTERIMMPLENTSRSPMLVNCWGRNPSLACSAASRGKSA